MSDIDELDEEEINRQLAELDGSEDDEIDLSDLEGLEDLEDLEDEEPAFDDSERLKEVEAEIAALTEGHTGPDLCQTLRKKLTEVLQANDKTLQTLAGQEVEYEELKADVFGHKDTKILELEVEIDELNDLLEDEEREGANMYTVFKRAETELGTLRDEYNKLLNYAEQRATQHKDTMKQLNATIKKCKNQITEHQMTLLKKVTQLTDDLEAIKNENNDLEEKNLTSELRMEELLRQRSETETLVTNESKNVSSLLETQEKELDDMHNQLLKLITDTEELENSNKELKAKVTDVSKEYRELNRKHNKITLEHDDAQRLIQRHERDATRQQKQVDRLEQEIEDLRARRKEVLKKIASA